MNTLYQFLRSRGYTRVRLLTLPTNHYVVIATLNGTAGRFVLDTGASTTCVSTELATHFHLNPKPSEEKASSASANELDTKVAHHNELMIGSWSSKRRSVVLFDMQAVNHALQNTTSRQLMELSAQISYNLSTQSLIIKMTGCI